MKAYSSGCKTDTGTTSSASPPSTPAATPNRLIRQEPGPVRLGFIPDEWFTFFFKKTGVSGAGTFAFTFTIFLMSKEILVMEHEYYGGLSVAILCIAATKKIGPMIAQLIDKEIDEYERTWTDVRNNEVNSLESLVTHEQKLQWSSEGQLLLIAAKRENVALQLEAAYRERLMTAYRETRKRLDYCVSREVVEAAIARRHMASWVIKEVSKDITDKIQAETLSKCFEDLAKLAKTFEGLKNPSGSDSSKK
ncbi:hypothetical protein ILUMI_11790 [Ignelater luminosus]|uniref:ATP synthase subunit b n=1 Tax=Ignelater luminosus TaxID=2038154 RepID=A0A8K0CZU9_IGNLU|nr:hypothetical protein ILUMI_11790 [Ignelater luminosus]